MVNNSINITKRNNILSEHKKVPRHMTLETQVLSWNRYINMVELNRSVGPNTALFITGSPTEIHIHSPKKICTDSLPLNITLCTSMVSETLLICSLVAERRFYGLFSFFFCDHRIRSQNTIRVTVPQLMSLQS
jgi:hypothetical protein